MRRHSILFMSILTLLFLIQSNLIAQVKYNCNELNKRNTNIIPQLFEAGKIDSINSLIKEWLIICDDSEEAVRLNVLMSIYNNTFDEDIYDHRIMKYLVEYRDKISMENNIKNLNPVDRESMKYIFSNSRFNRFSQKLAAESMKKCRLNSVAHLLASFYHGAFDSTILKLKQPAYHNSRLYSYSRYYREEIRNSYEQYILLTSGYWFPTGKINAFGTHPVLGLSFGYKKNMYSIQLNSAIRFLRSNEKFLIFQRYDWQESNFLRSLVVSLDIRRDLLRFKSGEINLGLGFGEEYFTFSLPFKDQGNDTEAALFLNFSCGYKFYWSRDYSSFSEVQFLFNRYFTVFGEEGPLSYTFRLTFGLNLNEKKNKLMKYLHY